MIKHSLSIIWQEVYAIISLFQPFHNVRLKFFSLKVNCKYRCCFPITEMILKGGGGGGLNTISKTYKEFFS